MPPYQFGNQMNDFYINQAQQMAQMHRPPYQGQVLQPQFVTRFVGSMKEAEAAMVDALSTYLFIDQSTGRIYMKRLGNNGLSEFYIYEISDAGKQASATDPMAEINARLSNIENFLGELRHDKSVSGDEPAGNIAAAATAANGADEKAEPPAFPKGRRNDGWKK